MGIRILGGMAAALAVAGAVFALVPAAKRGPLDPVARAAATTTAAGTADFAIDGHVTAGGQSVHLGGNGVLDMDHGRARMSVSVPLPGIGSTKTDGLFDGNAIYMRLPGVLGALGKPWVKLDIGSLAKTAGIGMGSLSQAGGANPADALKALQAVGGSTTVGPERIDGVQTTHYRATIDPKQALDKIPDAQSAGMLKQLLGTTGLGTIPLDVWIDGAGHVRRESISFSAAGTSMDLKVDLRHFGVPVDTTPPPADQVLDARGLLGS